MTSNHQRFRRAFAVATIAGALSAPAAGAGPIEPPIPPADPSAATRTDQGGNPATATDPTATSSHGFDWGDAGIGAASALALGAIGAGAAVATGRIRSRHPAA